MASRSSKRKKTGAGGAAAADPPSCPCSPPELSVKPALDSQADAAAFAKALEHVCDETEAALGSMERMRAEMADEINKMGMRKKLADELVDQHQLDTKVHLENVQSAAARLVQLMERLRIGPNRAEVLAMEAGASAASAASAASGGVQSSVCETAVYNLHRALADAELARATLGFERKRQDEQLEQRVETWRIRMTEQLDELREELEAELKRKETALRSELDEEKKKVERLRGSWCIFLLDAEQLAALQGELEEAMQRVTRMQERRACESTLCEKMPEAVCPITKKFMLNPVVAADGHTYERPAIERWIALNKGETKSPMTNLLLAHHDLTINWTMRRAIVLAVDAELDRTRAMPSAAIDEAGRRCARSGGEA
jgi:hypothetical protein